MSLILFVLKRFLSAIPVFVVVSIVVFLLLRIGSGDPAAVIAGEFATPEDVARIRESLGFDKPLHIQYWYWITSMAGGDFGRSLFSDLPTTQLIAQRLEPTVSLALVTIISAIVLAVPLGILAAWKAGTPTDRIILIYTALGFSVPSFVVGYCLIYVFSIRLNILPVQGFVSLREGILPFLRSIMLPAMMLGTVYLALIARVTRASVLEVLGQDFVRTARSKGSSNGRILFRHALPNASVPIVTVIGIGFSLLISGVVVTETVFNIPGLGRLVVDAILKRDYPLIQTLILLFASIYIVLNMLIDILYAIIDPRIRY